MPRSIRNGSGNGDSRATAEFWMKMGMDMGEMASSLKDLKEEFHKFCTNDFHDVCEKQDEMEDKLNTVIKTTGIIIAAATIGWTVANILLHVFKVL